MYKIWTIAILFGPSGIIALLRLPSLAKKNHNNLKVKEKATNILASLGLSSLAKQDEPPNPTDTCNDIFGNDALCDLNNLNVTEKGSSILDFLRLTSLPTQDEPPIPTYTCDDIFGNDALCDLNDLNVMEKTVDVRGVKMFYWIYENLNVNSDNDVQRPVIMINGGPGMPHNYMLPLKQSACSGRKIVFYDQVGTGKSSICPPVAEGKNPNTCPVNQTHSYLFQLNYYPEEVTALVKQLDVEEGGYHIFAHSWGSIIAELFAATRPAGLLSVVLGGALANSHDYIEAQWDPEEGNLGTLPQIMQDTLKKLVTAGDYNAPEYREISENLMAQFFVRTFPAPDCITYINAVINEEIYVTIQGPSEFSITPNAVLADMDLAQALRNISVPVLLINGKYDTMRGPNIRSMAREIKDVRTMILWRSGHMAMVDEPVRMNVELGKWFLGIEH